MTEATDTTSEFQLVLELPPELRNAVYRFTICESSHINIGHTFTFAEPAILQTNKQIRREALEFFYYENTFRFHISDLDCTLLRRWIRSSPLRRNASLWAAINHSNNWRNLKRWLRHAFLDSRLAIGMPVQRSTTTPGMTRIYGVAQFFDVMLREKYAGATWESVDERLEDLKSAMQTVKPGYMAG